MTIICYCWYDITVTAAMTLLLQTWHHCYCRHDITVTTDMTSVTADMTSLLLQTWHLCYCRHYISVTADMTSLLLQIWHVTADMTSHKCYRYCRLYLGSHCYIDTLRHIVYGQDTQFNDSDNYFGYITFSGDYSLYITIQRLKYRYILHLCSSTERNEPHPMFLCRCDLLLLKPLHHPVTDLWVDRPMGWHLQLSPVEVS